jgi:uncharacterized protein with von Willebrand factor type A (vWA) domain
MGGSFELEFGQRWKEIYQLERMRREQLEQELREHRERLESDMDIAYQDYQTHLMREGELLPQSVCLICVCVCVCRALFDHD